MTDTWKGRSALLSALLLVFATFGAALASLDSEPDAEVNPKTGAIETVDVVYESCDAGADVRFTSVPTNSTEVRTSELLTDHPGDDLGPRIAHDDVGGRWIAWWRSEPYSGAPDVVLGRFWDPLVGSWSGEFLVSDPGESSSRPTLEHDGQSTWVAWEIDRSGSLREIAVRSGDSPVPWPRRQIVGSTTYGGDLMLELHHDEELGGALGVWMTWRESESALAWSRFNPETDRWTPPILEPLTEEGMNGALERIRDLVTGAGLSSGAPGEPGGFTPLR